MSCSAAIGSAFTKVIVMEQYARVVRAGMEDWRRPSRQGYRFVLFAPSTAFCRAGHREIMARLPSERASWPRSASRDRVPQNKQHPDQPSARDLARGLWAAALSRQRSHDVPLDVAAPNRKNPMSSRRLHPRSRTKHLPQASDALCG